jgi:predicted acyltransferase
MEPTRDTTPTTRIVAIDALRGFDMLWLIGGEQFLRGLALLFPPVVGDAIIWQFRHARWEGVAFKDLIMPLFIFISGVVLPISLARRIARGDGKGRIWMHILTRAAILWVFGLIYEGHLLTWTINKLHLYCNALHAIAAGMIIAAFLLLHCTRLVQILITAALLLGYWALLALTPVPGIGSPSLAIEANLPAYVDKLLLGRFDDGIAYTWILPSAGFGVTAMLGAFAGQWLVCDRRPLVKALCLIAAGVIFAAAGLAWKPAFPMIKQMWTGSFALYSGGWSLGLLGLFYLLIDVAGFRRWAFPFVVIGANAILAYMSCVFIKYDALAAQLIGGLSYFLGPCNDAARGLLATLICWLLLYFLYRKKTFLKI